MQNHAVTSQNHGLHSPAPAALRSGKSRTSLANSVPILPLMKYSLEDQERHSLVKVIDRVLYKLEDVDHKSAACPRVTSPAQYE